MLPTASIPFRALASIRVDTTGYVGRDVHYQFHQHLSDETGNALALSGSEFYVDLLVVPTSTTTLQRLFKEAVTSAPNPGIPQELPSTLFEGRKQGDVVRFQWDHHPVELKLYQLDRPVAARLHQTNRKKMTFEEAFTDLKKQAELSLYTRGGFSYVEDVTYKVILTQVFKQATLYAIDVAKENTLQDGVEASFVKQALDSTQWSQFKALVDQRTDDRETRVFKPKTQLPSIARFKHDSPAPAYQENEIDGIIHRTFYLLGAQLKRESLQILVNGSYLWLRGNLEGVKIAQRQELLTIKEGSLVPGTFRVTFCKDGLLQLKFQITKS